MVQFAFGFLHDLLILPLALYAEMTEGLLSPQAEYASRPLKDEIKSEFYQPHRRLLKADTTERGCPKGRPGFPAGSRECFQSAKARHDAGCLRTFQILFQPPKFSRRTDQIGKMTSSNSKNIFMRSVGPP
jgi:hypothetical protein